MIPAKTTPRAVPRAASGAAPRAVSRAASWAAALGALAVLASGCAAPAADGVPSPGTPVPAADLTEQDVNAWLDGLVPAALERTDIPGAAVSVVHDGELLTARGYGHADTGTDGGEPVPVDPEDTLFRVGSVSKLFTATAMMQLVEEGRVDLDTDIHEYLDFTVPTEFDEPVTVRHLLTHTPGFEERVAGLILFDGSEADLGERLRTDPPEQVYPPGTVPAYSNYGNALVGYIVERVSGTPFEEYVGEHVLEPAGMTSSTFVQPLPEPLRDRMAGGYEATGTPAAPFETVTEAPAGALTSSATDMARFMLAHMEQADREEELLEPGTLEQMHSPALDADSLGTLAQGSRMTLGFFEEDRNGHRIIGHGGDTNYFHSEMQILPEEGTGVFVTLNGSGNTAMASHLLRLDVVDGFFDRYFPAEEAGGGGGPVEETAAEHAALAQGTYVSSRAMHSTFLSAIDVLGETRVRALADGRILVSPGPETFVPTVYEEIEPWVWREVGGQSVLSMRPAEDGESVEAIGYASAFTLLRADPERQAALAVPIILASVAVLLVAVLSWPIRAVRRRVLSLPARGRDGRLARVLARVGAGCALTALISWAVVIVLVLGFQEVPAIAVRSVQGLQVLGLLAILPAAWTVFHDVRHREGWKRWVGSALVLAALLGVQWFAITFGLLSPSVSY
ncbi:serine hydrolase domain-containing protein [Nocardiopsis ganjiahuensis]|uniref:serine hydrolase domain-containing protein n=1 Tax=Nocardiopsis ganjiahuensis TaxID=239984 RepID=UPI000349EF7A|nr:serine hydrolase domain-containing protein [Nocardiopsis ganjiahuensis]